MVNLNQCYYGRANWRRPWRVIAIRCEKEKKAKKGTNEEGYCEIHGCEVCYLKPKCEYLGELDIKLAPEFGGKKVCSVECKNQEEERLKKEKEQKTREQAKLWEKIFNLSFQLNKEIKDTFPPFHDIISKSEINNLKRELINEKIDTKQFADACQKIIDSLSLDNEGKKQWKNIYQTNNSVDLREKLLDFAQQERVYLVGLAKKYKDLQEQKNIPECKKCKLRREQPNIWPTGCEGWCKECMEQEQRKRQKPDNNDNPKSPPLDNTNNKNNSPVNPDKQDNFSPISDNPSPQTGNNDERERERISHGTGKNLPPTKNPNDTKPVVKKTDNTSIYLAGVIGVVIIMTVLWLIINAKIKKKNKLSKKK